MARFVSMRLKCDAVMRVLGERSTNQKSESDPKRVINSWPRPGVVLGRTDTGNCNAMFRRLGPFRRSSGPSPSHHRRKPLRPLLRFANHGWHPSPHRVSTPDSDAIVHASQ
jgi:hypothetical protein